MKRAFTIVELLTVVGIISILVTIVVVAAQGSIRSARDNRRDAMRNALEQAINAYHAQDPNGRWPGAIEDRAENSDEETCTFTPEETDKIFQEVVGKGFGKSSSGGRSMLVDASALFVADSGKLKDGGRGCFDNHANKKNTATYCGDKGCVGGIDFSSAANRNSKHYIQFSSMAFGYQGPENGKFCRFWVEYNTKSDSVTVSTTYKSK